MLLGLHTGSILYTNLVTDVRIAGAAGYDAIEITVPKMTRYLDAGYGPEDLQPRLGSLQVGMINSFPHIERQDEGFRQRAGAKARACAANYTWERCATDTVSVYREAIER